VGEVGVLFDEAMVRLQSLLLCAGRPVTESGACRPRYARGSCWVLGSDSAQKLASPDA
jgi:hypothetical protein